MLFLEPFFDLAASPLGLPAGSVRSAVSSSSPAENSIDFTQLAYADRSSFRATYFDHLQLSTNIFIISHLLQLCP